MNTNRPLKVTYDKYFFEDHTTPIGCLPNDDRAQACWLYYILAQENKERVGDGPESQIIIDGSEWRKKRYVRIKKRVAMQYGIDDPAEMDKFWEYVEQEILRFNTDKQEAKGLPLPDEEYKWVSPIYMPYNPN